MYRLTVARFTYDALVAAIEGKTGFLPVIEHPARPPVRVVTGGTPVTEPLVVSVILLVTIDAFLAGVGVHRGYMAFLARHNGMQADQREAGQIVVKANLVAPAVLVMAALAALALLAVMRIIGTMAIDTLCPQFLVTDLTPVARRTGNLLVAPAQREVGLPVVIEA